jgi:hypothetical protein
VIVGVRHLDIVGMLDAGVILLCGVAGNRRFVTAIDSGFRVSQRICSHHAGPRDALKQQREDGSYGECSFHERVRSETRWLQCSLSRGLGESFQAKGNP